MAYEPLHRHRPRHSWTNGDIAAKVGADLGLPPDDEQRWILDTIFAEKAPEKPASFEVAVIGPRQNIKTSTLGVASLTELFVRSLGIQRQIWSSHLVDTSKSTFNDFKTWIGSNHEYADLVDYYEGHQDLSIYRRDDPNARIEFRSRTGKASRGLTGVKRVTLDEALYLEPKHVGAVYPTMLTRPGSQVRIASSAGLVSSAQLRQIRKRGRGGKDARLAYVEYGARFRACAAKGCLHVIGTSGCALDDRDLWWQASPALWSGRIVEESLEDMRRSMPPEEWMREFFSWWEDPASETGGALSTERWRALRDPDAARGSDVVFGVDVAADRSGWIAVAWRRPDGAAQVMLVSTDDDGPGEVSPLPAFEVVARCEVLSQKWGGRFVPPRAFVEQLERKVSVMPLREGAFPAACDAWADAMNEGTIRHGNQPALNNAVAAAQWRYVGTKGEREWVMRDTPEVGPLVAATRALHGLMNTPPPPPPVTADSTSTNSTPLMSDVAIMGF